MIFRLSNGVNFWQSAYDGLQTLSCNISFLCKFYCSHLFFQNQYLSLRLIKLYSMVLHTRTNISISKWHFNTLLSSKLKGGNVKHILFQQCTFLVVVFSRTSEALCWGAFLATWPLFCGPIWNSWLNPGNGICDAKYVVKCLARCNTQFSQQCK